MVDESRPQADVEATRALAPNLALLAALQRTGRVTHAAQLVGIPQPTASRRLAGLESLIGAPVAVPDGRGVRLTRAGTLLAEAAESAAVMVEAGVRQVREEVEPQRGHVVLAFLHLLGRSLVPELLRDFRVRHPHVRFSLVQGSRQQMLDRLLSGTVDIGLVAPGPHDEPRLSSSTLADQELDLSVPSWHRLARRRRVRIDELATEDFVMLEPGYGLRTITDTLCEAAGFRPRIAFEGQESDTVRGLVGAGLGVALLPASAPGPVPGVVELALRPRATRSIDMVWPATQRLPPAVATFRDFVLQHRRQESVTRRDG